MPDDSFDQRYIPKEHRFVGTTPIKQDGTDKVTGRAVFGADTHLPGMLVGKVLRSPHAHAEIISIDTSKAETVKGVKAVCTSADFPDIGNGMFADISTNCMARGKALYDGHAVAAVAATSEAAAKEALKLIDVEYKVLPHVIDAKEAAAKDAPILHPGRRPKGMEIDYDTNITERGEWKMGDVEAGFAEADFIVEDEYVTQPMHQGYIEPQACVANYTEDGQAELWTCTQSPWVFRLRMSEILKMEVSRIKVTPSELGGAFGGKTSFYADPLAVVLSRKAQRPVKIVLTRGEVLRSTGPVSGIHTRVKIGMTKDGKFTAAEGEVYMQSGAFAGAGLVNALTGMLCRYSTPNVHTFGFEVASNRPKVNAFRAPNVPQTCFAVEGVIDTLSKQSGIDPLDLRLKNAAAEGFKNLHGETFGPIGFVDVIEAAKKHPQYSAPLGPNQGRGVAAGFWFNRGGETTASVNLSSDGTVNVMLGTPDVAGSRISMSLMVAEELGIDPGRVRTRLADTSALGYNHSSAGSRVTFSSGLAVIECTRKCIATVCKRAADTWGIDADSVAYEDGVVRPAGANAGDFEPLTLADICGKAASQGGAIAGHAEIVAKGAGPGFAIHICDIDVDPQTGFTKILRYAVIEDCGKAIHPHQVEGQYQGAAVQGIGWALNEEYIYNDKGVMENPSFLDYRMPVASDLPMIDAVIIEVPNPNHPYGVRGVGEVPLTPTMAAVGNAIGNAIGVRPKSLPMSPPKLLKLMEENELPVAAE